MSKSVIFPAGKRQTTIITITTPPYQALSMKELEEIRDWVNDHRDIWPEPFKEMPSLFGYKFEMQTWPIVPNNKECIWLIENYEFFSLEEKERWQAVFDEATLKNEDDLFIFIAFPVKVTRLNKDLLPFL